MTGPGPSEHASIDTIADCLPLRGHRPAGFATTLRHHKQEVEVVLSGVDCGLALTDFDKIKEGDVIECFEETTLRA